MHKTLVFAGGVLAGLALSAGCGDGYSMEIDSDRVAGDREAPTIVHQRLTAGQPFAEPVALEAVVTDASGVQLVEVVYRQETASEWKSVEMTSDGESYSAEIPGADVGSGGMYYYLRAVDELDNAGCLPEECEADPYRFGVTAPLAQ